MNAAAILGIIALFVALAVVGAAIPVLDTQAQTVTHAQGAGIVQRIPMMVVLLIVVPIVFSLFLALAALWKVMHG